MPDIFSPHIVTTNGLAESARDRTQATWREYTTHNGRKYYNNEATNAVQWKPPPGWGGMTQSFVAAAATSAGRSTRRSAVNRAQSRS